MLTISLVLLAVALVGLGSFFLYPVYLRLVGWFVRPELGVDPDFLPTVTVLTATRNAADLVLDKIENTLGLDYPADRLEIVVSLDGPDPAAEQRVASLNDPRVHLVCSDRHLGKIPAINRALPRCNGEVLLMSDVDALLEPDALRRLVSHLGDERVGGVGGLRVIGRDKAELKEAQRQYISADSRIKVLESRLGYNSANDGKLYAIRRELMEPIAEGVTDDLYVALLVIARGRRFLFEPLARAEIRVPSRHPRHELERRRRVVCSSLAGIRKRRELLNPFRYGLFSIGLFLNKVMRRLMPVFLSMLLLGSLLLAWTTPWAWLLVAAQIGFYGLGGLHLVVHTLRMPRRLSRLSELIFYFCVGNYGTLLGLYDFLSGRQVLRWEPVKQDQCT